MDIDTIREVYRSGRVVLINKPLHWTSFDVVNKIRWHLTRALEIKKIKVGHAGTLDPLAGGLLIVCIGKATKMIEFIQDAPKTYMAGIDLGATTPSYDLETEIDQEYPVDHITEQLVENVLNEFKGSQMQMPPVFSAKKVNGKPAYEYARKNIDVALKAKNVFFHEIDLQYFEPKHINVRIKCSKGTYIRSFAHDLGKKLNSGAYLQELTRTAIGQFSLDDAWSLDQYINKINRLNKYKVGEL